VATGKEYLTMARVFGVHTFELKPGVTEQDFERCANEFHALQLTGVESYWAKGDKGERKGKYVLILVMESAARDVYYGSADGEPPSVPPPEEFPKWWEKLMRLADWTFTDYQVLGK
jgi:hypothetical protein